ncbi:MAG TPA: DNA polymerase III subunit delta [Cytophagales bacterium]|jgi:DNA polymerase-3 subunit delta'|nr:DNA polymerase III subunit delta [Cytophagales bacterium]
MRFGEIPGLSKEKKSLAMAMENDQVAHAQMFLGPSGSANLAMALAYASLLNCENPVDGDACGTCSSCIKNSKFIHPDVHFVFPVSKVGNKDAVSNSYISEWRAFLSDHPYGNVFDWSVTFGGEDKQLNISKGESRQIIRALSLKAFEGKYKIMMIWMPEYMHPSAANAILKILEEPPERTVFLLVAQDKEQIITTILSRTQVFNIPIFEDQAVVNFLKDEMDVASSRAMEIAHMASGNMREAIRMANENEDSSNALFYNWMRYCYAFKLKELMEWTDRFAELKKSAQKNLLVYGLSIMRESLLATSGGNELMRSFGEGKDFVAKFHKTMDIQAMEELMKILGEAHYHLERNANAKILFLDMSLQMAGVFQKTKKRLQ